MEFSNLILSFFSFAQKMDLMNITLVCKHLNYLASLLKRFLIFLAVYPSMCDTQRYPVFIMKGCLKHGKKIHVSKRIIIQIAFVAVA